MQSADQSTNNSNVVYMFNKFFLDLLRTAKNIDPSYAATIKTQQYHSIDKQSHDYIQRFVEGNEGILQGITEETVCDDVEKIRVLNEFTVGDIVRSSDGILFRKNILEKLGVSAAANVCRLVREETTLILRKSICMAIMAHVHTISDPDPTLFGDVITQIVRGEQGLPPSDEMKDVILRALIGELASICMEEPAIPDVTDDCNEESGTKDVDLDSIDSLLENSSLGQMAKAIASDIDMTKIQNCTDPRELFSDPTLMKDIYGKVASMINTQMQNGCMNQDDLFGECMNLMRTIGVPQTPLVPTRTQQRTHKRRTRG